MADGLCTDDPIGDVIIEKPQIPSVDKVLCETINSTDDPIISVAVKDYLVQSDSAEIFDKLCSSNNTEGILVEDDCRKKRCVDRYDSSESSDSGVAVLSCTDCSGSSTASSDITDPGSPFSTTSSHSEDSGSSTKMPPTQITHHHPPWPWTADEGPPCKRSLLDKEQIIKKKPTVSATPFITKPISVLPPSPIAAAAAPIPRLQQGKITEYFKSQIKSNCIKKDLFNDMIRKNLMDQQQTQFNSIATQQKGKKLSAAKKVVQSKMKKITIPRKILPAPSNLPEKLTINDQLNNLAKFTPTVTLTALSFPPNYTYLHTKGPKPPEATAPLFLPQYTAIPNRAPCLNVIQPVQKLHSINGFNCVKLNATVVPVVKVNPMPARIVPTNLSVETAIPTVLSAKPKGGNKKETARIEEQQPQHNNRKDVVKSPTPTPDSDSGVSLSNLEVCISENITVGKEEQKSPILSKPKTIRFPAKQAEKEEGKPAQQSNDGQCRWDGCDACFNTSGALLEHLQVKHVISQATQEHYVCLWLGCKVHGRTSCSRSWLERHVLAHAGTKPFRCIVDGCGQRYNSQLMLERHVNSHFNSDGSPNNNLKKSPENACKLLKRNGKRIKFRRQPWSARMFDFMDAGIMEGLQYKLLLLTQKRTLGKINEPGDTVHLQSQVLAKRIENDGSVKYLLKWHPVDIIADEWVSEKEYKPTKMVSIPHLKPSSKSALSPSLFPTNNHSRRQQQQPRQKHRRKPASSNGT